MPVTTRWPCSPCPVPAFPGSGCYDSQHSRGGTVPGLHLSSHARLPFLMGHHLSPLGSPAHLSPTQCLRSPGPLLPVGLCLALGLCHSEPMLGAYHGSSEPQPRFAYLSLPQPRWKLSLLKADPPPLPHPHFRPNESIAGFLGPVFSRLASPEPSPAPGAPSFSSPG